MIPLPVDTMDGLLDPGSCEQSASSSKYFFIVYLNYLHFNPDQNSRLIFVYFNFPPKSFHSWNKVA